MMDDPRAWTTALAPGTREHSSVGRALPLQLVEAHYAPCSRVLP
jgi:hypothetical protein